MLFVQSTKWLNASLAPCLEYLLYAGFRTKALSVNLVQKSGARPWTPEFGSQHNVQNGCTIRLVSIYPAGYSERCILSECQLVAGGQGVPSIDNERTCNDVLFIMSDSIVSLMIFLIVLGGCRS